MPSFGGGCVIPIPLPYSIQIRIYFYSFFLPFLQIQSQDPSISVHFAELTEGAVVTTAHRQLAVSNLRFPLYVASGFSRPETEVILPAGYSPRPLLPGEVACLVLKITGPPGFNDIYSEGDPKLLMSTMLLCLVRDLS